MSAESETDRGPESEAVLERFQRWYHVPVLAGILSFMLWIRTRAYDEFVTGDRIYFRGNDAYYHYRATMYSVRNWPRRLYADPYTQFPYGQNVGHFGTLFDQFWATVALVVGLGDPSAEQVGMVAVLAPAITGTAIALPTYYLARRLGRSRVGGVVAAAVLALVPQSAWMSRSTVGFYDHHIAESLLMALLLVVAVHALLVVQRERPVYEQVVDRDWEGLRPSLRASVLLGLTFAVFMHTWPSSIVFAGIFGIFLVVAASLTVVRGESPEHVAFLGAVSTLVATVAILPWVSLDTPSTTTISLVHALFLPAIALGCVVLGALARYWDQEDIDPTGYPAAVGAFGAVSVGLAWLLLPEITGFVWSNVRSTMLLGQSTGALTVGEAQPMDLDNLGSQFYDGYGFAAFTALVGLVAMAARGFLAERGRLEYLLVALWTVFLVLMSITQVRFHYYLVVAVAVLNGWLVAEAISLTGFPALTTPERFETHHVLVVVLIVTVLFFPLVLGGLTENVTNPTAAQIAADQQPGSVQDWDENFDWMSEQTPEPGTFGGDDGPMSYYGPFDRIDEDYEYPTGAYGVMSWWDYGHWITVEGERIAVANPFQQGTRVSSAYFQETDEERATAYLDAIAGDQNVGGRLYDMSDEELADTLDQRTEQQREEEVRYVMVDDQMAGGKFGAITEWTGPGGGTYIGPQDVSISGEETRLPARNQQFHETMLGTMYFHDGAGLEQYRLVKEDSGRAWVVSVAVQQQGGEYRPLFVGWDLTTIARNYPGLYGTVIQHLRLGGSPEGAPVQLYDVRQESPVKTYERVQGATLAGEAEPGDDVLAQVTVETAAGRQFTYAQSGTAGDDGSFELTVPYATDDQLGTEDGYTEPDVQTNGTYTVRAGNTTLTGVADGVEVPEPAIYEGQEIEVDLEPAEEPDGGDGADENASESGADASESSAAASGAATDADAQWSSSASSATPAGGGAATDRTDAPTPGVPSAFGTIAGSATAVALPDATQLARAEG